MKGCKSHSQQLTDQSDIRTESYDISEPLQLVLLPAELITQEIVRVHAPKSSWLLTTSEMESLYVLSFSLQIKLLDGDSLFTSSLPSQPPFLKFDKTVEEKFTLFERNIFEPRESFFRILSSSIKFKFYHFRFYSS